MAKTRRPKAPALVHVLRAELKGSLPKIYRTFEVRSDTTLGTLHAILQIAFVWDDAHLHEFSAGGRRIGSTDREPDPFDEDGDVEDEEEVLLGDVLPAAKSKLLYAYDFGDSWEVAVRAVRIVAPVPGTPPAPVVRLTGGARAAPPEDCGGLGGFYELCDILLDPQHPEHASRAEWLGDDTFDPTEFDAEGISKRLEKLR